MTESSNPTANGDEESQQSHCTAQSEISAANWEFLNVIHALVPAETTTDAEEKGEMALTRLSARHADIDSFQLIAEFDTDPEPYLTRRWGPLPGSTPVESGTGQRLIDFALKRSTSDRSGDGSNQHITDRTPYLCTLSSRELVTRSEVRGYRQSLPQLTWLVPGVTFRHFSDRAGPE